MKIIIIILSLFLKVNSLAAPVRTAQLSPDGILNINTALGIATIIQLPETIQSVIIGDQSGFKVEYLDKAVTIKPLRWGAKTNLYLVTEKRRYNLRLQTLKQETADFIVYVQNPKEEVQVIWRSFEKKVQTDYYTFEITRIGKSKAGFIILDGKIKAKENHTIKPEQFWILQNKESRVINGLYLSSLKVTPKYPLEFGISLATTDLDSKFPITLELRTEPPLVIDIPEERLWK
jgi:hypothetical protein